MPIILLGIVAVIVIYVITTYNFFASSKARVAAAIQEIGNQLKRQADLIPNLEAAAKGYLKHEKDIFKMLTEARKEVDSAVKSGNVEKMARAGSTVANLVPQLQIAIEDNPEIKGAEVVRPLMDELRDTADKVMYSRRLLIDLTADYNVKRVSVPSSLIANMFGFTELKGLDLEESESATKVTRDEMKTPKVNLD